MTGRKKWWKEEVRKLLGQGYGVEDITLMTGIPADMIRQYIADHRRLGSLEIIIRPRAKL